MTTNRDRTPGGSGAVRSTWLALKRGGILGAFLFALSFPHASVAVPGGTGNEPKTLTRFHDPVVVQSARLSHLLDHRTSTYRLYAVRAGRIEPIPFQFDERGRDGQLVLSNDGTDDDFTFDGNDELVFMAKDTGDRVDADRLPAEGDAALEIEVADRSRGEHGWAYLVHFSARPPPRSSIRYATFDSARGEARAHLYAVSYSRDRGNFVTGLRINPAAGGTGQNVVDQMLMRIRPTFSLLFTTWTPTFTEKSFLVTQDEVKNGPVRAVRRVRESLDLGRFLPEVPHGTVSTYYYFSSFVTPSTFSIPALALKALRNFEFETLDDFGREAGNIQYSDETNQGLLLGRDDPPVGSDRDHDWWAASSSAGTFLHALIIPQQWRAWGITRGTVFAHDGRPFEGGRGAGYSLLGMTNLQGAGSCEIDSAVIVLPRPYESGDEAEALAMLRRPLEIQVRTAFKSSSQARLSDPTPPLRSNSNLAGN